MNKKWRFFAGAAVLALWFLLMRGVPIVPVALGIVLAALMTKKFSLLM